MINIFHKTKKMKLFSPGPNFSHNYMIVYFAELLVCLPKYLGIWCTADLKPHSLQCQHAASKAMRALGLIKRTFKYFNIK